MYITERQAILGNRNNTCGILGYYVSQVGYDSSAITQVRLPPLIRRFDYI